MDSRVILCPSGPFRVWWDGTARRLRQERMSAEGFCRAWSLPVLVEGITVGQLFDLLGTLSAGARTELRFLTGVDIAPFAAEAKARTLREGRSGAITLVEIEKHVRVERGWPAKTPARIEVLLDCVGRGGTPGRRRGRWALDLVPVSALCDAVIEIAKLGSLRDERGPRCRTLLKFRTELTVGELLTALLVEVSFWGDPAERDRRRTQSVRAAQEVMAGKRTSARCVGLRPRSARANP